jgi:hypothetical protein
VARPEDEYPHPLPDPDIQLPYKDTWMLCFHDPDADVSVTTHLTLSANRLPGLRVTLAVRHGRRELLETRYLTPTVSDDGVASDLVTLTVLDPAWTPDKHLRLSLRHRVDGVDVTGEFDFRGRYFGVDSIVLTPGMVPSGEGVQRLGHAEQACTVTGRLTWGDEVTEVTGNGYRDRSFGYRKSDKMAPHGYAWAQLHLPDVTCGLLSWRHPDAGASAPLPVGAWLADADGVQPATDGLLHLSAEGRLHRLALTFADGRAIDVTTYRVLSEVHYPYHEPEMDGPALGTMCWDQHVAVRGADGAEGFAVLNVGTPFLADVLRNSVFCVPGRA